MNHEYDVSRPLDDGDPVVTYTRVSGRRKPKRPVRAPAARAPDPVIDAAEIHQIDVEEPVDFHRPTVEPRVDGVADVEDFVADRRRPDWLRYGLVAASLAVVVGVGILASTVGLATILPGGVGQDDERSSVPALALDSEDSASEGALASAAVREIPLPSGSSEAARDTEAMAPIPRPRPENVAARVEPDSTTSRAASASQTDRSLMPERTAPKIAAAPASPEPAPVAGEAVQSDSLITSIEETLARVDAESSEPAGGEPTTARQPASAPQAAPPALPAGPPVMMTEPTYPPPAADVLPPPRGLNNDIPPPPSAMKEGGYSAGPVPPEPVPEAYPQALPVYPDGQSYPQNPRVYPVNPYARPSESAEETEARRPGFLRRTLAKASDVVERVFSRN